MFRIYSIKNNINGKQYIGFTSKELLSRWKAHCRDAANGSERSLQRAIRKYGKENFVISQIDQCEDRDVACWREMFWICSSNTYNPSIGYNLTYGGDGAIHTKESCEKISIAAKGRKMSESTRKNLSIIFSGKNNPNYGNKYSPEIRAKISDSKKKLEMTPERIERMRELRILRGGNSPETRAKISAALKGQKRSPEQIARKIKSFSEEHRKSFANGYAKWCENKEFVKARSLKISEIKKQKRNLKSAIESPLSSESELDV